MKFLIVLGFVALAKAASIYQEDTPEVAAAKAAHLAEVAKAAVAVGAPAYYPYLGFSSYAGPVITPAKAKAATAAASPVYYYAYYSGPTAIPVVLPDGHLADTPEVAAAKAAHFAEVAKAQS